MQSLKARFPNVIFFTTDLDARLFHSQEIKWTRNLLVASSYGLQLDSSSQKQIPPFRDCYKTALYRAVLESVKFPDNSHFLCSQSLPQPRMFEIGHDGPRDISENDGTRLHPRSVFGDWYSTGFLDALRVGLISLLLGVAVIQLTPFPFDAWKRLKLHWPWLVAMAVFALAYGCVILYCHYTPNEQPFSWSEGISIWPSEIIRLATVALGAYVLFISWTQLNRTHREITREFKLGISPAERSRAAKSDVAANSPSAGRAAEAVPDVVRRKTHVSGGLIVRIARWWVWRSKYGITNWKPHLLRENNSDINLNDISGRMLWHGYCLRSEASYRLSRCVPAALVFLVMQILLMTIVGSPVEPYRGNWSYFANYVAVGTSVLTFIFIAVYVIDATRLCKRLVEILAKRKTVWPSELEKAWQSKLGVPTKYLDEWLDLRFIARLTEVVGRLIWWPFILLALLFVARNPYFANYDWPLSMWLIFGLNAVFVLGYAIALRRTARNARDTELRRLRRKLIEARGNDKDRVAQIEQLIAEIERMDRGAFAPLASHPIVHAVLLTIGGISIPGLLEYACTLF
jgi:hypothetical protein